MGSNTSKSFKNRNTVFTNKVKTDKTEKSKIISLYINPNDFPDQGLIVVSYKRIYYYSPITGICLKENIISYSNQTILITEFNRVSGNILIVGTSNNTVYVYSVINSFTLLLQLNLIQNLNLKINSNSFFININFKIKDTLLISFSSGDIIKYKLYEEPINITISYSDVIAEDTQVSETKFNYIPNIFSESKIKTLTNDSEYNVDEQENYNEKEMNKDNTDKADKPDNTNNINKMLYTSFNSYQKEKTGLGINNKNAYNDDGNDGNEYNIDYNSAMYNSISTFKETESNKNYKVVFNNYTNDKSLKEIEQNKNNLMYSSDSKPSCSDYNSSSFNYLTNNYKIVKSFLLTSLKYKLLISIETHIKIERKSQLNEYQNTPFYTLTNNFSNVNATLDMNPLNNIEFYDLRLNSYLKRYCCVLGKIINADFIENYNTIILLKKLVYIRDELFENKFNNYYKNNANYNDRIKAKDNKPNRLLSYNEMKENNIDDDNFNFKNDEFDDEAVDKEIEEGWFIEIIDITKHYNNSLLINLNNLINEDVSNEDNISKNRESKDGRKNTDIFSYKNKFNSTYKSKKTDINNNNTNSESNNYNNYENYSFMRVSSMNNCYKSNNIRENKDNYINNLNNINNMYSSHFSFNNINNNNNNNNTSVIRENNDGDLNLENNYQQHSSYIEKLRKTIVSYTENNNNIENNNNNNNNNVINRKKHKKNKNIDKTLINKDLIILGTTKGNIIIIELPSLFNQLNKVVEPILLLNFSIKILCSRNDFENRIITYIYYDVFFDSLFVTDCLTNFYIIENINDLLMKQDNEDTDKAKNQSLPIFSFFDVYNIVKAENIRNSYKKNNKIKINSDNNNNIKLSDEEAKENEISKNPSKEYHLLIKSNKANNKANVNIPNNSSSNINHAVSKRNKIYIKDIIDNYNLVQEKASYSLQDMPIMSVDHDVLMDKDVILYDTGKKLKIKYIESDFDSNSEEEVYYK